MIYQTIRFCSTDGDKAGVSTNGYLPRVDDELSLPRKYFPSLYVATSKNDSELWEVERVVHRFDDQEYIGADVYIRRLDYKSCLKLL